MHVPPCDWVPADKIKGIAEEGTTFVWSQNGVRVFEDGVEVPRVKNVQFDGKTAEDQTATLWEILDDGSLVVRLLERPFTSTFEKGHSDA